MVVLFFWWGDMMNLNLCFVFIKGGNFILMLVRFCFMFKFFLRVKLFILFVVMIVMRYKLGILNFVLLMENNIVLMVLVLLKYLLNLYLDFLDVMLKLKLMCDFL